MSEDNATGPEEALPDSDSMDAVIEHCSKCSTLLDVTGCHPLMETACPSCGALIKVLREYHHFVLLSELGRGGSGTVYRAFDETLERDVALKLLRSEHLRDPEYLASLETEALTTASINHPHVVKVFSTGRKNGLYYIAMEIVSGGSLAERLDRMGRLSESTVISLGIQIAEGLQAAYERGMLHRDVKPGNVLFSSEGDAIKVADFGLAMPLEQAKGNSSSDIWGTPDYIAPEKLLQEGEDIRSDIYSLGCTLFHCLTGRPPFETKTVQLIIDNQKPQIAPSVQVFAPKVSGATAAVIKRCLAERPADRFQSYHELVEHLRVANELLANPVAKSKTAAAASAPPAKKSNRAIWTSIAVIFAMGVVAIAAALLFRHKDVAVKTTPPAAQPTAAQPAAPAPAKAPAAPTGPEYRILDMRPAYTADTRRGIFQSNQNSNDTVAIARYGIVQGNGVPFELVDPAHDPSGRNITILKGGNLGFPQKVEMPVASVRIYKLHILGGIAGWGWSPNNINAQNRGVKVAKLTVTHAGGAKEIFEFTNGVEFVDHRGNVEAPGSVRAPKLVSNDNQLRTFSVTLSKSEPVEKITIESMHPGIAPVFAALTAELRQ